MLDSWEGKSTRLIQEEEGFLGGSKGHSSADWPIDTIFSRVSFSVMAS